MEHLAYFNDIESNERRQPAATSQISTCSRVIPDDGLPFNFGEARSVSYEKNEQIGEGGNGQVFNGLVRLESENDEPPLTMQVAVKTINKKSSEHIEQTRQMAEMKHRNVIRTYGYSENEHSVDVIMERGECSLDKFMESKSFGLTNEHKAEIGLQIAHGMDYFHSNNVLHRDLKPANVVLSELPRNVHALLFVVYKIIDPSINYGTIAYMSPEAVDNQYSKESDVYAFGILIWELFTEQEPFEEFTQFMPLAYHIGIRRNTPTIPDDMDEDLAQLLRDTWSQRPNDRPTFAQIIPRLERIKHKFSKQSTEENAYRDNILNRFGDCEPTTHINESSQVDHLNVPELF